jgi:hypothetical protein
MSGVNGDFGIFVATITRTELGLPVLNINDHINYQLADQILGGTQSWNKQMVKSPYVDGEVMVNRSRGQVQEQFQVQVRGGSQSEMQQNIATLIEAFSQFAYQLTIEMEDATYTYQCDTADYTVDWTNVRMMAKQALVKFQFTRSPKLINGGW